MFCSLFKQRSVVFFNLSAIALSQYACTSTKYANDGDAKNDVVEIAVRRLKEGQDEKAFTKVRDHFVGKLKHFNGVGADREFKAFFNFASQKPPTEPVYIGMTQYDNAAAFQAVGKKLGSHPKAAQFFKTFTPEAFTALKPLKPGTPVDIASIANKKGQVLEVAVRDLSKYESFDKAKYESARDAFLGLLRQQKGFVAEYQWVSVLDENIVVGMTVYESQEAFGAALANPEFAGADETKAFLFSFPPNLAGYVNTVVK